MIDDTTTGGGNDGGDDNSPQGKGTPADANLPEPIPKDKDLFAWMEGLFYGQDNSYPELIDCRVVYGSRGEKFGPFLEKKPFAPANATEEARKKMPGKSGRLSREELIDLCNRWTLSMQRDCDQIRKPQTYGLHAWHFTHDDEPYSRFLKTCKPSARYANGVSDRKMDGLGGSEDEEDLSMDKRFSMQTLAHKERMFELYESGHTGLLDRFHRELQNAYARISYLQEQLDRKSEQLERALSLELEREERRTWAKLKMESAQQGLALATQLAPPLINQLVGKPVIPTQAVTIPIEVTTLKNFFKTKEEGGLLTVDQIFAAFGQFDPNTNQMIRQGVLTREQFATLLAVAEQQAPVEALDNLMPGGSLEITGDQAIQLQSIFGVQLMPLMMLFQEREKKKRQQNQEQK